MPVFPVMAAVADSEFGFDFLCSHLLVEEDVLVQEAVFIAAVYEPLDASEILNGLLVCIFHEIKGRILPYAAVEHIEHVSLVCLFVVELLGVKPGTHRIAG